LGYIRIGAPNIALSAYMSRDFL